ncbi:rod shape-determining protein MreC [Palleronia caenipelagi]|uniref:Cell shape-determining protein MreC n=1 Tax=Palleronia caenipelagi TaxID=2489174 RepID=A0A547QAR4_9RHOB|nr:rod shape-determining protein MreC [Palleronia caenipelagi]TRD23483.1 rod shape-determining protein MreC [Palleronia caenipelagi]
MARQRSDDFSTPTRRILIGTLIVCLLAVLVFWRIDSPRAERMRAEVVDRVIPPMDWALLPVTKFMGMVENFQSYSRIYEQNRELRRELQQMRAWKEAALQLEQENAKLLDLNKVNLDPKLTFVTGVVLADSGSPFNKSVLLNIGAQDGIQDGWAATDGLGLVGRISGVGASSSRVILLTDSNSRVPVTIQPSGQQAILSGNNQFLPLIDFLEPTDLVRPGDRVVTSGDGGMLPAGLLVGSLVIGADRRLRVRLAADYERLEFLRVLRALPAEAIGGTGDLVPPLSETPLVSMPESRGELTDGAGDG